MQFKTANVFLIFLISRYRPEAYRPGKKPYLTVPHIKARRRFVRVCLKHPERSKKIVFSDEKVYHSQPKQTNLLIRRRRGPEERFKLANAVRHRTGGPSCNVWYTIGPYGKGTLYCAEHYLDYDFLANKITTSRYRGFDAESYEHLLENHALPELDRRSTAGFYFMQDKASIHKVKTADKKELRIDRLFRDRNCRLLKWPAKSPDLNPIEKVHFLIQRELDLLLATYRPKNKHGLFNLIQRAWKKVPNQKVLNIYNGFLGTCLKVCQANGLNNFAE